MKLSQGISALTLATMLAMSGVAFAEEAKIAPTVSDPSLDPATDQTGMAALGVNITAAGNTAESVKTFVAGLSSDQQVGVSNACSSIRENAAANNSTVVSFCDNLIGS